MAQLNLVIRVVKRLNCFSELHSVRQVVVGVVEGEENIIAAGDGNVFVMECILDQLV